MVRWKGQSSSAGSSTRLPWGDGHCFCLFPHRSLNLAAKGQKTREMTCSTEVLKFSVEGNQNGFFLTLLSVFLPTICFANRQVAPWSGAKGAGSTVITSEREE